MHSILYWVYKLGPKKHRPQAIAQLYVAIRERYPSVNIISILSSILKFYKRRWSLSPERTSEIFSEAQLVAHENHNLSDYDVLLRVSAKVAYPLSKQKKENMSYKRRKLMYDAAYEGLNEGLGSFRSKARSLYTTKNKDRLEQQDLTPMKSRRRPREVISAESQLGGSRS